MSAHMTFFRKSAGSAYFSHNGGQTTIHQRGKVNFFESLNLISIIIEVKPSMQKSAYESAVSC